MKKLIELRNSLKEISDDEFTGVILDVFNDERDYLIELNKKQLSEGKNPEGNVIGTYSKATESFAAQSNPRQPKIAGEPYNFEWTGGLFENFTMLFGKKAAFLKSDDTKVGELKRKYGELFGLSPESLKKAIDQRLKNSAIRKICLKLRIR